MMDRVEQLGVQIKYEICFFTLINKFDFLYYAATSAHDRLDMNNIFDYQILRTMYLKIRQKTGR